MLKMLGLSPVGPNDGKLIAWYDPSELTAAVDKGEAVVQAYDRLEASGTALRRELGLDEADKPTPEELEEMIWKKVAGSETLAPTSVQQLTGATLVPGGGPNGNPGPVSAGGGSLTPPVAGGPAPGTTPASQPPRAAGAPSSTPVPARVASASLALEHLAALDMRGLKQPVLNGHGPGRHRRPRR
jgi:hypothetical protein